jgi:hypothetical protein
MREVLDLLAATRDRPRNHAIVLMFTFHKPKASELLSLKVGDFDPLAQTIRFGESGPTSVGAPLAAALKAYVDTERAHAGASSPLFMSRLGSALEARSLRSLLKRLGEKTIGRPVWSELLRAWEPTPAELMLAIESESELSRHVRDLIERRGEVDSCDYKAGGWPPDGPARWALVRSVLAMANISGGGELLFGVEDRRGHRPAGLTMSQVDTFDQTAIRRQIQTYGSPEITVHRVPTPIGWFGLIRVQESRTAPVICKKTETPQSHAGDRTPQPILRRAAIYARNASAEAVELVDERAVLALVQRYARNLAARTTPQNPEIGVE